MYIYHNNSFLISIAIVIIVCFVFILSGIGAIKEYYNPSIAPIDVYRGKTTLEITYRDSIAIDSVVVWKEEVK